MFLRWWTVISIGSFGALILVILFITRKPLCINSKLVDKIDRVSIGLREEIYRCDSNKKVIYSTYWSQQSRQVALRLNSLESILDRLNISIGRKPQVVIISGRQQVSYFHDVTLYLSEDLFLTQGVLERELIRFWLKERNEALFSQNQLLAEALVENILLLSVGRYNIHNYEVKNAANAKFLWPQNLKSSSLECRYSKKFSDSISFCIADETQPFYQDVKPYFVRAWIESSETLKIQEKLKLIRDVILLNPENVQKTSYGGRFLFEFASRLQKFGLNQPVDNPEFDLVYAIDKDIDDKGNLKKSIQEFSRKNEDLKIAIMDNEKVLFYPSGVMLNKKSLKSWKTKHMIYQSCKEMSFNKVSSFVNATTKILLIRSCEQNENRPLQKYYQTGIAGFALQNPETTFVHIHLPSLVLKETELDVEHDIFEQLSKEEVKNAVAQSFGWQQVEWNKQLKAYAPKAYVDAIDLFRIESKSAL